PLGRRAGSSTRYVSDVWDACYQFYPLFMHCVKKKVKKIKNHDADIARNYRFKPTLRAVSSSRLATAPLTSAFPPRLLSSTSSSLTRSKSLRFLTVERFEKLRWSERLCIAKWV